MGQPYRAFPRQDSTYTGAISILDNSGTITVPITLTVGPAIAVVPAPSTLAPSPWPAWACSA